MKIEFTNLNYWVNETEKKLHIFFNRKVQEEEKNRYLINNKEFFYEMSFSFVFLYSIDLFIADYDLVTIYKKCKAEVENMFDEGGVTEKEINKASLFLFEMVLNAVYSFQNKHKFYLLQEKHEKRHIK